MAVLLFLLVSPSSFGLTGALPGIVIEDRESNKNFIFSETVEVTAGALKAHFAGFMAGELKANLKSQPEPVDNNGPVKTIVGTTFEAIALDETKDVLVEFYAPWCGQYQEAATATAQAPRTQCAWHPSDILFSSSVRSSLARSGHCKSLAPKYETLGEQFASDANIVIAKVDSTENDTPAKVEGFPTLIFYPAGDKKNPITFEGDRSVEAMAAFIKENRKSTPAAGATEVPSHEEL